MIKLAARIAAPASRLESRQSPNSCVDGSPDVIFENLRAARESDISACGSALVNSLSSTVLINGQRAVTVESAGAQIDGMLSGANSVIIGDTFTGPASPSLNLPILGFGKLFRVTDSETGLPLAGREYIARIGDKVVKGRTNHLGVARIMASRANEKISLHIMFSAPVRLLHELAPEV